MKTVETILFGQFKKPGFSDKVAGFKFHELTFKVKRLHRKKVHLVLTCPLLSFRTTKQVG